MNPVLHLYRIHAQYNDENQLVVSIKFKITFRYSQSISCLNTSRLS